MYDPTRILRRRRHFPSIFRVAQSALLKFGGLVSYNAKYAKIILTHN